MRSLCFFFTLLLALLLVAAVMNESIIRYAEQKYHLALPQPGGLLREAGLVKIGLEKMRDELIIWTGLAQPQPSPEPVQAADEPAEPAQAAPDSSAEAVPAEANSAAAATEPTENTPAQTVPETTSPAATPEPATPSPPPEKSSPPTPAQIPANSPADTLLIGDSLMQGVAVALQRELRRAGHRSINLAKQNTGLAFKSYFDWAGATKAALAQNPKIKTLIVLLGTNDPWDLRRNGVYVRFASAAWLAIYTQRVDELLSIARRAGVRVLWYELPPMKKPELNEKIKVLNEIYERELRHYAGLFIRTEALGAEGGFRAYLRDEEGRSVKVRSDDGVHFTTAGARLMAGLAMQKLAELEREAAKDAAEKEAEDAERRGGR